MENQLKDVFIYIIFFIYYLNILFKEIYLEHEQVLKNVEKNIIEDL